MTGKTKAAMPGRLSHNALLKHRQITRLAAGGQTLSRRNPHAQINCVHLTYGHQDKHEQYSGSVQNNVKRGSEVPTNSVESCENNQPSLRGAVHSITGSNPVQPFGSMPCRKSSLRARAFSQLPRLTPSRLAASFSCWRSSGVMRIWKVGDKPSPFGVLSLLIVDMYVRNLLLWILLCTYVITAHVTKATPRSGCNTTEASYHHRYHE